MRSRPEYIAVAERNSSGQLNVLRYTVRDRQQALVDEAMDSELRKLRADCPKRRFRVVRLEVTGSRANSNEAWESEIG